MAKKASFKSSVKGGQSGLAKPSKVPDSKIITSKPADGGKVKPQVATPTGKGHSPGKTGGHGKESPVKSTGKPVENPKLADKSKEQGKHKESAKVPDKKDAQKNDKKDAQKNDKKDAQKNDKKDSHKNDKKDSHKNDKKDSQKQEKADNEKHEKRPKSKKNDKKKGNCCGCCCCCKPQINDDFDDVFVKTETTKSGGHTGASPTSRPSGASPHGHGKRK